MPDVWTQGAEPKGNTGRVSAWRKILLSVTAVGCGSVATACSSSDSPPTVQAASARSACALMTVQEASSVLGAGDHAPHECQMPPGDQSTGVYMVAGQGPLLVTLSWNPRSVSMFRAGLRHYSQLGAGHSIIRVSGFPVESTTYRFSVAGNAGSLPPSAGVTLTSMKAGYVLTLESFGDEQSQMQKVLSLMLAHL